MFGTPDILAQFMPFPRTPANIFKRTMEYATCNWRKSKENIAKTGKGSFKRNF